MSVNDDINDAIILHALNLSRYAEGVRRDMMVFFDEVQKAVVEKLRALDLMGTSNVLWQRSRLERLLAQTKRTMSSVFKYAEASFTNHLTDLGYLQAESIVHLINSAIGASLAHVVLLPVEVRSLASNVMVDGNPAAAWWHRQEITLRMNLAREIRAGVALGETNEEIIQRIIGMPTGMTRTVVIDGENVVLPVTTGGVMDISRRHAEALVRTSVQTISNDVLLKTYQGNDDIIESIQAVATLDDRTSTICIARDGAVWYLKTGKATEESPYQEDFPGPPPWHWKCRTILAPNTKSWDTLLEESNLKKRDLDKVPAGTRASMDGQVPAQKTYEEWLKGKSESFQRQVLGDGRYELWKDGSVKAAQFIDQRGNPLTIDELKKISLPH